MKPRAKPKQDVDTYIAAQPEEIRPRLEEIRKIILKTAPKAEESISYMMPGYKLHGPLVYFGGYKNHIGFYPTPTGIKEFAKELAEYPGSKGAIQFPHDRPLPLKLIARIVKFRMQENTAKAILKKEATKKKIAARKKVAKKK